MLSSVAVIGYQALPANGQGMARAGLHRTVRDSYTRKTISRRELRRANPIWSEEISLGSPLANTQMARESAARHASQRERWLACLRFFLTYFSP